MERATVPNGSEAEVPLLVGLRARALIGVMVYSFARISAAVAMEVGDYFSNGKALVGAVAREKAEDATKCRRTTA